MARIFARACLSGHGFDAGADLADPGEACERPPTSAPMTKSGSEKRILIGLEPRVSRRLFEQPPLLEPVVANPKRACDTAPPEHAFLHKQRRAIAKDSAHRRSVRRGQRLAQTPAQDSPKRLTGPSSARQALAEKQQRTCTEGQHTEKVGARRRATHVPHLHSSTRQS